MSRYTSLLIDALLIGFVLFTLIHGTLPNYLAFAAQSSGSGINPAAPGGTIGASTAAAAAFDLTPLGTLELAAKNLIP